MRRYVEASAAPSERRTHAAVCSTGSSPIPELHARFVNTLARLEYVGVRKILKSRRAERLDLDGLQHILDEAVHALRLKKAAAALGRREPASTSGPSPTARRWPATRRENYLQALDHRAEEALGDLPDGERAEANYLLTSAAIEVRAQVFYPVYDRTLQAHDAGFSVAAITQGRGSPPRRDGGRPRGRAPRLAARGSSRCSPPRRRSSRASWARSKTRVAGVAARMAEWRTLAPRPTSARSCATFGVAGYRAHQPIAVGTINTNVRVETDGGPLFLRINEGKSQDDVGREAAIVAHVAARGVPTPAPRADAGRRSRSRCWRDADRLAVPVGRRADARRAPS